MPVDPALAASAPASAARPPLVPGGPAGDERESLRRLLLAHRDRQRRLLLARAALQGVMALAITALLAAVLLSLGASRALALGLVIGLGLVLFVAALLWPLLPGWRQAGELLVQARRVEALEPELRARLVTAVDRALLPAAPGLPSPPISQALLARAVSRALVLARAVPADRVHPLRPVQRALLGATVGALVLALSSLVLPVGPLDAVVALATGQVAAARLASAVDAGTEQALVGDITLRYVFPDYTGIEAVEVPNSDGTIHAPPGTRVQITARTAQPFDAAALQVDQESPTDARLLGGRDISGELTVAASGTWCFVLFDGNQAIRSPRYDIVVEADAPPVVIVSQLAGPVPVDTPLRLRWQADDDFGVESVLLQIEQDGQTREVELRRPLDPTRQLQDMVTRSPRELGLKAGDTVTLRVVAVDNDHTAGGKRGLSSPVELTVIGPQAAGQQLARYYQELRDALVLVLADFLVETDDLPIANDPAAMQRWVGQARTRFDPVRVIMDRQWHGEEPSGLDGVLTREALEGAARLFRFTLTTFDPSTTRRVTMGDLGTFEDLSDKEIASLEVAIGTLDQLLQRSAEQDVAEMAAHVAQTAKDLADAAPNAEASALLARLDQLERMMQQLSHLAQRLSDGQLKEFMNSRMGSAQQLVDEIRKALAEGRMDDARAMLAQLAAQLSQLGDQMKEQAQSGEEQEDKLGKAIAQTMEELKTLEQDQRDLASQLDEAQKAQGGELQQQVALWTRLDELSDRALGQARDAVSASGDGSGWRVDSIRRLESVQQAVSAARDAVRARDVPRAQDMVQQATWRQSQGERVVQTEGERPRPAQEAVPAGVAQARKQMAELGGTLAEIDKILDQLAHAERAPPDPELARQAQQLSQQQSELRDRQGKLQGKVESIERQLPTAQGQASESMKQAGQAMEQADQALQQGQPAPGQGHMQDAANQVQNARQELEHQQQQLQQMQRTQQAMRGNKDGSGGKDDKGQGEDQLMQSRVEIPAPEKFTTPEAYRRALLEGMQADVPEEYRAQNRQYYEELVRQ